MALNERRVCCPSPRPGNRRLPGGHHDYRIGGIDADGNETAWRPRWSVALASGSGDGAGSGATRVRSTNGTTDREGTTRRSGSSTCAILDLTDEQVVQVRAIFSEREERIRRRGRTEIRMDSMPSTRRSMNA